MAKVMVKATGQLVRVFIDGVTLRLSGSTADKTVAGARLIVLITAVPSGWLTF
jgi:hypothetical protein